MAGKEIFGYAQPIRIRPHPRQGRLHGLLHDLPDLAGHGESAFTFHSIGLDEQHVPPRGSPCQAYGYARTLRALGNFAFAANLDAPKEFLDDLFADDQLLGFTLSQPARLLAADGADGAFQAAHARFARVVPDHVANSLFGKFNLLAGNPVLVDLSRDQVSERDVYLLFFGVALQFNNLHAIAQRLGDRVEHVRGSDEEHLGKIEGHVEIVVAERGVLFGIQRFEQRGSRVAAEIASHFIDLVEHEDRVLGLGAANALDDLPRQRTDVGAPVTADLRFVVHTAERKPHELASECPGDRFAERSLAHSWRSHKA